MRTIIQYIRSLFCNHDWEYLGYIRIFDANSRSEEPAHIVDRWRCKKCGYVQRSKT